MERKTIERKLLSRFLCLPAQEIILRLPQLDNLIKTENYRIIIEAFKKHEDLLQNYTPSQFFFDIVLRDTIIDASKRNIYISALLKLIKEHQHDVEINVLIKELEKITMFEDIILILKQATSKLNIDNVDLVYEELLNNLNKIPSKFIVPIQSKKVLTSDDSLEAKIDVYLKKEEKISTCIKAFDIVTGGFGKTEFVTLGASTGQGKSATLLWLAEQYAERGYNVLFITMEMSLDEMLIRHNAMQTGIPIIDLRKKQLSPDIFPSYAIKLIAANKDINVRKAFVKECILYDLHKNFDKEKLLKIASKYPNRPGKLEFIDITTNCRPLLVEQEIIKAKQRFGRIDVVLIDFITVMEYNYPIKDRPRELGMIARELKLIARRQECLIWTAAQLDLGRVKSGEMDTDVVKYSKAIVENSDWFIAFHRTDEDKLLNQIKLKLVKSRHSQSTTALLQFNFSTMQCKDLGFADPNEVPQGYTQEGNSIEDKEQQYNKYYNLLEEYETIIKELDNPNSKEQPQETICLPDDEITMLKKIKELFPNAIIKPGIPKEFEL